jgi:hypothetical protein
MKRHTVRNFVSLGAHSSRRTRVRVIVAGAVLAVGISAGAAYGYLTSSASATGHASTGTLVAVTLSTTGTPSSSLVPGGSADVVLGVNNPNAYDVTLVSVTGGPGSITADPGHSGCTTTGVTFANQTGLHVAIAASGLTTVHLAGAASMSAASSTGCQGAAFSIPVTITVRKP